MMSMNYFTDVWNCLLYTSVHSTPTVNTAYSAVQYSSFEQVFRERIMFESRGPPTFEARVGYYSVMLLLWPTPNVLCFVLSYYTHEWKQTALVSLTITYRLSEDVFHTLISESKNIVNSFLDILECSFAGSMDCWLFKGSVFFKPNKLAFDSLINYSQSKKNKEINLMNFIVLVSFRLYYPLNGHYS